MKRKIPVALTSEYAREWYQDCISAFDFDTPSEKAMLREAALCLDGIEDCLRILKKEGRTIQGDRGTVSHPVARQELQHRAKFVEICRALGISMPKDSTPIEDDE